MGKKVIKVDKVSKKFSRALRQMMRYAPMDISRSLLGLNRHSDSLRKNEFWAVDQVSFDLEQGQRIGLIGRNGSGKSTLLKLLNGILLPDDGVIRIKGRVGALIEVGAGFHPLLTGKENIFVNGAILGMEQREIRQKFDDIVSFADIGDFLESPVKFYSNGMRVRLGFSVAVHSEPDILLIDEVLAVGDFAFQKKCFDHLDQMVERGTTIVLVSHSMATVQRICPIAMLLEKGKSRFVGDSKDAAAKYYASTLQAAIQDSTGYQNDRRIIHRVPGSMSVYLSDFQIFDEQMQSVQKVISGAFLRFILRVKSRDDRTERLPRIAIRIIDPQTEELLVNIQTPSSFLREAGLSDELSLECDVTGLNLAPGIYRLETKIGGDGEDLHDVALIEQPLEVNWSKEVVDNMSYKGRVYLPGQWRIGSVEN
ncbi:MAG: polysaccharide ABC transporter ATP-binding protein [Candidatus Hodarchaeota archaeon]